MRQRKGFLISFDALIALMVLFALFIAATAYFAQAEFQANNSVLLKEIAADSLTVLDKSGKLGSAIKSDKGAELRAFMNRLPHSICTDLRIYPESDLNNASFIVLREGCKKEFEDMATVKRSVLVRNGTNAGFYIAELRAWQRVTE